jgi:sec-independent protein translocase protein TatA
MGLSFSHLILVLLVVLVVFGTRRVPEIMKDLAKGYRAFTDGLQSKDEKESLDRKAITGTIKKDYTKNSTSKKAKKSKVPRA